MSVYQEQCFLLGGRFNAVESHPIAGSFERWLANV
jgi:hypothetical protein